MVVYLVPIGRGRFELYSEPPDEPSPAHARAGFLRRAPRLCGPAVGAVLFVAAGLRFRVPGPNLIAYYFAFRLVGHYLSWRGARQAMDRTTWSQRPEPALAALASLAELPRDLRASRARPA